MKRARSVATRCVGVNEYKDALRSWQRESGKTYNAILGPKLVDELRQVQPNHVVQLSGLFDKLLEAGCVNAVLFPSKVELALKEIFAMDDVAGQTMGLDLFAHKVGKHITTCFSMLRVIVLEEDATARDSRKSACFKKRCITAETALVGKLTAKVVVDDGNDSKAKHTENVGTDASKLGKSASCGSIGSCGSAVSGSSAPVLEPPQKARPTSLPSCFAKFLEKVRQQGDSPPASARDSDAGEQPASARSLSVVSLASTKHYDEDGFPTLTTGPPMEEGIGGIDALIKPSAEMAPLTSTSKARKKQVRATEHTPVTPSVKPPKTEETRPKTAEKNTRGVVKQPDTKLYSPSLSVSSKTENIRIELCCKNAEGKRVYIYGATENKYGANIVKDAEKIKDHIAARPGITMAAVHEFKNSLLV